jgi:hypothetical protein
MVHAPGLPGLPELSPVVSLGVEHSADGDIISAQKVGARLEHRLNDRRKRMKEGDSCVELLGEVD